MVRDHRRLAAIVSADVVGYSRLMGRDEGGTLAALKAHRRELIDPKIAEYDGRIVKTLGDGLLLEFPSVVEAVRCAVDVQRGMAERNASVPADRRIEFRIGINLGDIIIDEGDIFGDGVNVAARIQTLADPGGICASRVVRDQVLDKLSFAFEEMGAHEVKNIARPVEIYRVLADGDGSTDGSRSSVAIRTPRAMLFARIASGKWLAVGVLAFVAAGLAAWLAPYRLHTPAKSAPALSVAVLPFATSSTETADRQLADALTQDLTTALLSRRWLTVASARRPRGDTSPEIDARAMGRELNVRYVIDGDFRRAKDVTTIGVRVLDAEAGTIAWSDRFEFEAVSPHGAATRLGTRVGAAIYQIEMRRARTNPVPGSAWDLVLRGDAVFAEGFTNDPIGAEKAARKLYDEALRLDPNFVPALTAASMSVFTAMENDLSGDRTQFSRALDESDTLTARAVLIDDKDSTAWYVRGLVLAARGRLDEAMTANLKAETLAPASALFVTQHALIAMLSGQFDEALAYAERAATMDATFGLSAGFPFRMVCNSKMLLGRYDDAIPSCEKATTMMNSWTDHAWLTAAYANRGDRTKAEVVKADLLKRQPTLTIDRFMKSEGAWGSETFQRAFETHVVAGLRQAGLPER